MSHYHSEISIEHQKNGISNGGLSPTPGSIVSTTTSRSSHYHSGKRSFTGSGMHSAETEAAMFIRKARERDNKNLAELNDTFANYIENVRFLAAQNRSLTKDYDTLTIGLTEDVKNMDGVYAGRLADSENLIRDTNREQKLMEDEIGRLKLQLNDARKKYEDALNSHSSTEKEIESTLMELSAVESQIALFKRHIEILETNAAARLYQEKDRIRGELDRLNAALELARRQRLEYKGQYEKYVAETAEVDIKRKSNDKAFIGMQIRMLRGMSPEDREFFKRELAKAIREIRAKYDFINEQHRTELESKYWGMVQDVQRQSIDELKEQERRMIKVSSLEIELTSYQKKYSELNAQKSLLLAKQSDLINARKDYERLHYAEVRDREAEERALEEECAALKAQLDLTTADDLEREIGRYHHILESEESRVVHRQHINAEFRTSRENNANVMTIKQKKTAGTQMAEIEHDSSRGDVLIRDESGGRYLILENKDLSREKDLSEWQLKRKVDNDPEIHYQLPRHFVLKPGQSVKIWARNQGGKDNPPEELIWSGGDSFGFGSQVKTILVDSFGTERANRSHGSDRKTIGRETESVVV
jgi:hypothetical protein